MLYSDRPASNFKPKLPPQPKDTKKQDDKKKN